jgi:hypothetical protein
MQLHIVNYRLQLLLLSLRNPVENSYAPGSNEKDRSSGVTVRKPRD